MITKHKHPHIYKDIKYLKGVFTVKGTLLSTRRPQGDSLLPCPVLAEAFKDHYDGVGWRDGFSFLKNKILSFLVREGMVALPLFVPCSSMSVACMTPEDRAECPAQYLDAAQVCF